MLTAANLKRALCALVAWLPVRCWPLASRALRVLWPGVRDV